ncbi:cytochrome P450 [Raphidocelis subcapitata]|uniref:Cytochrome P450 n=1 Tax=Raphidocelis subcapitata TaxID=307507 RepID=A0A2V0PAV6_9CHLO|nr:cytochrome P450 [Raphidocelis subcapitata]|eukprot:GBF95033.1 cytochrome P450 [Raphidocelis subcapitata]
MAAQLLTTPARWLALPAAAAATAAGPGGGGPVWLAWETAAAAAAVAALLLAWRALVRHSSGDLDRMPGPWRSALPIVGNVLDCLRPDFHRVIADWADQYGGIYRMKFLWRDTVVVTDPTALAAIMGRGEGAMDKASAVYAPINMMCDPHRNANMLTSPSDDKWKAVRKGVAVSFAFQNIKKKFPLLVDRVNELIARVAAQGPEASIDVDQAALRVTLDIIGLAGFGHDYESVKQDKPAYDHLLRVLPRCFTEVMLRLVNPARDFAPGLFKGGPKGAAAFAEFQRQMRFLLEKVKADGEPDEANCDIGAQVWRVLRDHPEISEDRMLSEIGMLFVEGFETTGHTTSWALLQIATHPEVQSAIASELDCLGLLHKPDCPPPRELDLDDLKRLPYLTAALKEAMRMLPVVSIMGRVAGRAARVGPYAVPAGTIVATPLFAIHNSKHNWDAPHEFRPDRWAGVPVETFVCGSQPAAPQPAGAAAAGAGAAAAQQPEAGGKRGIAFMPFSEGPRNCVGQSLARVEVMTLLAKLLGSFQIELAPEMGGPAGVRARESTHLTLQTAGTKGIRCHLRPRSEHVAGAGGVSPAAAAPPGAARRRSTAALKAGPRQPPLLRPHPHLPAELQERLGRFLRQLDAGALPPPSPTGSLCGSDACGGGSTVSIAPSDSASYCCVGGGAGGGGGAPRWSGASRGT